MFKVLVRGAARAARQRGQASVELVAVLPFLVLVAGLLWQAALAGQAMWLAGSAARAAARAQALSRDPRVAADGILPARLRRGLRVRPQGDGSVVVAVPVPAAVGGWRLGFVQARARFAPQGS
jgi:pilus assembly protein CpaE